MGYKGRGERCLFLQIDCKHRVRGSSSTVRRNQKNDSDEIVSPDTRCGWVGKIVFEPLGVKRYEIKVLLDDRGGETDDARDDIDVIELGS